MLDTSLLLTFADDNPMAWTPLPAFTGIGVFLIALIVLWWKVWPVITQGLDDRNDKILSEIKAAEDARAQAKDAQENLALEIDTARKDAQERIANARVESERLFDEMKAKNERELAERISRANADIETARKAAVAELHAQAVDLATTISTRILGREINAIDQAALIEESIRELDATGV